MNRSRLDHALCAGLLICGLSTGTAGPVYGDHHEAPPDQQQDIPIPAAQEAISHLPAALQPSFNATLQVDIETRPDRHSGDPARMMDSMRRMGEAIGVTMEQTLGFLNERRNVSPEDVQRVSEVLHFFDSGGNPSGPSPSAANAIALAQKMLDEARMMASGQMPPDPMHVLPTPPPSPAGVMHDPNQVQAMPVPPPAPAGMTHDPNQIQVMPTPPPAPAGMTHDPNQVQGMPTPPPAPAGMTHDPNQVQALPLPLPAPTGMTHDPNQVQVMPVPPPAGHPGPMSPDGALPGGPGDVPERPAGVLGRTSQQRIDTSGHDGERRVHRSRPLPHGLQRARMGEQRNHVSCGSKRVLVWNRGGHDGEDFLRNRR